MKILVVDDSKMAREPMELQLKESGHQVLTADDGLAGLERFSAEEFDLVITDIRMPQMDGLELLSRIKEARPEQDVIIVTGYGDMDSSLQALRLGAVNYLMKPINLEEMTMAVNAISARQELSRRLKEQQTRLNQARKMADLGLVSAGVAHEINNPNTFIRGNIQTIKKFWDVIEPFFGRAVESGLEPPPKLDFIMAEMPQILEAMLDGTDRIKKIVENMAVFSRLNETAQVSGADLNSCVRSAIEILDAKAEDIELETNLTEDLPPAGGPVEHLTEIVIELLKNSYEAVGETPIKRVAVSTSPTGEGGLRLEVEDSGTGIKPEDKQKVFTPFFSTDPRIGRPGLGLYKVFTLVQGCGGEISFTTREGKGACFTVNLKPHRERIGE